MRFVFHAPISPNRPKGLGRIKFAITAHSSALFPSPMHALWAASSLKVRVDNFFCEMQPAAAARDPQRLSAALFQLSLERNSHRRLPQDRGITVRVKPLCAVIFVCFLLLPAAPIHAEWPSIQPPQAPSSGIAQKFLNGLRNPGAHHHRTESSPPLPRPRPPELPRESVELNKAAPEVAPASKSNRHPVAPTSVEASKVPEGGPAAMSNQTPDANRTPAESAPTDSAKAPAEVAAPVEANEAPAELAPVSGSNKATPELPPAASAKPNEAAAPVPIND